MKNEIEKINYLKEYYDNKIQIVNFGYWLAFPYDTDTKKIVNKSYGFFEQLVDKLKQYNIKIEYINLESEVFESPIEIEKILKHNLSIAEMKYIRKVEFEETKDSKNFKRNVSKDFINKINVYSNDRLIKIDDLISTSKSPIVICSMPVNEIYHRFETVEKLIDDSITEIHTYFLDLVNYIKNSIKTIYLLNKFSDIYIMGFPKNITPINVLPWSKSHINKRIKVLQEIFHSYNLVIKNICKQYNVSYINIENFNSYMFGENIFLDKNDHSLISNTIIDKVYYEKHNKSYPFNVVNDDEKFDIDNAGLRGMLKDLIFENNYHSKTCIKNNPFIYSEKYNTILKAKAKALK